MTAEFGSAALKMMGALGLILVLILALSYGLRRLRSGSFPIHHTPAMRLLGMLTLAPKRAVALIEVSDQWFLVGVGTENVTLISEIEPLPDQEERPHSASDKGFQAILQNVGFMRSRRKGSDKGQHEVS